MDLTKGLHLATGDPTTSAETTPYAAGSLGQFFMFPAVVGTNPQRIYQYVKITSVTSVAANIPVYWADRTKYEVTTAITNLGHPAGILVNDSTHLPTVNQFIYIQVRGKVSVVPKGTPTATADATGQPVVGFATIGQLDTLAIGTAPTTAQFGVSAGALAAGLIPIYLTVALNP